jgi:cytochrome c oxidase subunit 1
MGAQGMPRRYWSYPEQFTRLHGMSSVGAYILGLGFLVMFGYLMYSLYKGRRAAANPWGALTMEWETKSPPIPHNFETDKKFEHGPYDYDKIEVEAEEELQRA